jgi:CTP:molybdopterin cytidylyltransferase MocA
MGQPKLALHLGGRAVLEWVVAALRAASVEHVLVVLGPGARELDALARNAGAQTVLLDQDTADMRATIMLGLRWLAQTCRPQAKDRLLLIPADHPMLEPEIVQQLLTARAATADRSIVVPTFEGARGHPVLLDWAHVARIELWPADLGLNSYLRSQQATTLEWPVASPAILRDLDTPSDFAQLLQAYRT